MPQVPLPVPQGELLQITPSELELHLVLRDIQWNEHVRALVQNLQSAEDTQAEMKYLEPELSEFRDELLLKQTGLEQQVKSEWQLLVEQMEQTVREERVLLEQMEQKAREERLLLEQSKRNRKRENRKT